MRELIKRCYSLVVGRRIGEKRYRKRTPFMTGPRLLCLGPALSEEEVKTLARFRVGEDTWNGLGWDTVLLEGLTYDELSGLFNGVSEEEVKWVNQ